MKFLGQGNIAGIPVIVIIFAIFATISGFMLTQTRFGKNVVNKAIELALGSKLKLDDYYLFNTTHVRMDGKDKLLSVGMFGHVFTFDKEMLRDALEEAALEKEEAKLEKKRLKEEAKAEKKRKKEEAKAEKKRLKEEAKAEKKRQKEKAKAEKERQKEEKKRQKEAEKKK